MAAKRNENMDIDNRDNDDDGSLDEYFPDLPDLPYALKIKVIGKNIDYETLKEYFDHQKDKFAIIY